MKNARGTLDATKAVFVGDLGIKISEEEAAPVARAGDPLLSRSSAGSPPPPRWKPFIASRRSHLAIAA
jgi:hypothetical protein